MANKSHLLILDRGKQEWNKWRANNPEIEPDLSGIEIAPDTSGGFGKIAKDIHSLDVNLSVGMKDMGKKYMSDKFSGYDFSNTRLDGAKNFNKLNMNNMILEGASMVNCNFENQDMLGLNLRGVNLSHSNLKGVKIIDTNLSAAQLIGVNLRQSSIINSDLSNSDLSDSKVFGMSAWDLKLENAKQKNILITQDDQPSITIDNLKVAQFIYLLINNSDIRDVIDTVANKAVLILGNFSNRRIQVLHQIKEKLRSVDFIPILFDFDKPLERDFTETIVTLAHMSKFIIADLSEQRSIPHELAGIIPQLEVPVKPIIVDEIEGEKQYEYGMFNDFKKYRWVLDIYRYSDVDKLLDEFQEKIIDPALAYD